MYKILRIVSSVVSALILAASLFVFIYAGIIWGFVALIAAAAFFGLTLLFKHLQEKEENKNNPPPPRGDFITGKTEPPPRDHGKD